MVEVENRFERVGSSSAQSWFGLENKQTGKPIELASAVSLHAQVTGDFGTAGKVTLQGSNAAKPGPDDWAAVIDKNGVPVEFISTDAFKVIDSVPRWLRPRAYGDPALKINVMVLIREQT